MKSKLTKYTNDLKAQKWTEIVVNCNVSGDSKLCFRPFEPPMEAVCSFIWKRYSVFTKAAGIFLEQFKKNIANIKVNSKN